jgi:hypothetical protein
LQVGVHLGGWFKLAVRGVFTLDDVVDEHQLEFGLASSDVRSKNPKVLYSGLAGVILFSRSTFLLSPGLTFWRSDVSDYGSFVGLAMPIEWVTPSGLRIGLELDAGRVFGGVIRSACGGFVGPPTPGLPPQEVECETPTQERARDAGAGFYLHFQLGWGFNHPEPEAAAPTGAGAAFRAP